jgi:glycogenin glucosyltransferase
MVTPNVSQATREALHPAYCTRILEVEPISFPAKSIENKQVTSHVKSWSAQGELTKLHIFRLDNYDTVLYIDADCLVVKDITQLLELGKIYQESEALVAAAPDILPPDKFNAGVLVIRPSQAVYDNMMQQRSLLTTYDGGDTGFLNAYFSNWYTDMPPFARLKFGYNAQRFLYHCTYEKQPNYWDLSVAPDLHIIHYSSSPKPWESKPSAAKASAQTHLQEEDVKTMKTLSRSSELEALWWKWYAKSQNYTTTFAREQAAEEVKQDKAVLSAKQKASTKKKAPAAPMNPKEVHKLVAARYKELRREGKDSKEAMLLARRECGLENNNVDASTQVAAMFGLSNILR